MCTGAPWELANMNLINLSLFISVFNQLNLMWFLFADLRAHFPLLRSLQLMKIDDLIIFFRIYIELIRLIFHMGLYHLSRSLRAVHSSFNYAASDFPAKPQLPVSHHASDLLHYSNQWIPRAETFTIHKPRLCQITPTWLLTDSKVVRPLCAKTHSRIPMLPPPIQSIASLIRWSLLLLSLKIPICVHQHHLLILSFSAEKCSV